jgi:SAM-dependent methyltransferase
MSMRTTATTVFAAVVATAVVVISLGTLSLWAQSITYLAPPGEPAEAFPRPLRPVADIVSPIRSTEQQRDAFNESGEIARFLGFKPGMTVGDIGAGSGYHTVRLSHLVGPSGQVIAQDVIKDYLIQLARRTKSLKLSNVKFAFGEPHDPRLPRASLDAAILVHMYHEVAQPYAFLYNLAPALRPGARVGIVDLDRPTSGHGTPLALLACELAAVDYRQISVHQLGGDLGYLAIFSPPAEADRKPPRDIVPCSTDR